jgi:hypothetical protein
MRVICAVFFLAALALSTPGLAGQGEPQRPAFIPEEFVFLNGGTKNLPSGATVAAQEYALPGDTENNYRESIMVIYRFSDKQGIKQPAAEMAWFKSEMLRTCAGSEAETISYPGQPGSPAGMWASCPKDCATGKPNILYTKSVLYGAPDGRVIAATVQRTVSGEKPRHSLEQIRDWVEGLKSLMP